MAVSTTLFLGKSIREGLGKHEKFDEEARERALQKVVDGLRTLVPKAIFGHNLAASLTAQMNGSEEDVQRLEQYFSENPTVGFIKRDGPILSGPVEKAN